MTRTTRDSIGYLVVMAFCLLLLVWAIPNYTPEYPGYGAPADMVPIVATWVMMVMAIISLLRNVVSRYLDKPIPAGESEFPEESADGGGFTQVGRVNLVHLGSIMIPCVLLIFAIDTIGYVPASLAFLMLLQVIIGSRHWLQSASIAVALVATLYIIMRYGFGVPVPGPQLF